jgi:hypothetical protein
MVPVPWVCESTIQALYCVKETHARLTIMMVETVIPNKAWVLSVMCKVYGMSKLNVI